MTNATMIKNMSNEEYHAHSAFSSSQIKTLNKTPAHFYAQYLAKDKEKKEPTACMLLGTTVHALLLEAETFDSEFIVKKNLDGRTKEGKEYNKNFPELSKGKTIVSEEMYQTALKIVEVTKTHPVAKLLNLPNCINEASIFYTDRETGLNLRVRPDFHIPPCEQFPNGLIVDLKTTKNAEYSSFSKDIHNLGYHLSASMYCEGFMELYNTPIEPNYILLVAEKVAPFGVIAYQMDSRTMLKGNELLHRNLATLAECLTNNHFPSYSQSIKTISLPNWAFK